MHAQGGHRQGRAAWLLTVCLLGHAGVAWSAPNSNSALASQTATQKDAASQLVALIHAPTLAQQPTELLTRYAQQQADKALQSQPDLSPRQQEQLAKLPERVHDVMVRNLKWGALLDAFAATYRRVYSPEEIQAQLRFYRSKEGQAVLSKQARLNNQLIAQTSASLKPVYAALQKTIDEQVKTITAPATAASTP